MKNWIFRKRRALQLCFGVAVLFASSASFAAQYVNGVCFYPNWTCQGGTYTFGTRYLGIEPSGQISIEERIEGGTQTYFATEPHGVSFRTIGTVPLSIGRFSHPINSTPDQGILDGSVSGALIADAGGAGAPPCRTFECLFGKVRANPNKIYPPQDINNGHSAPHQDTWTCYSDGSCTRNKTAVDGVRGSIEGPLTNLTTGSPAIIGGLENFSTLTSTDKPAFYFSFSDVSGGAFLDVSLNGNSIWQGLGSHFTVGQLYEGDLPAGALAGKTGLLVFTLNAQGAGASVDLVDLDHATFSAVPIPAALWLLASALGTFGFARRRGV